MTARLQQVVDRFHIETNEGQLEWPADLLPDGDFAEDYFKRDIKFLLGELRKAGVKVPKPSKAIRRVD